MRASPSSSLPHRNALARITCEAARRASRYPTGCELPKRSPSKQPSLSERSGRGHAPRRNAWLLRCHPTPPGGITAHSDSTRRSHRAGTPRPSRCTPSGIAKRVDAGSHPVGYREARRSPTLELEPRGHTRRPTPPGGVATHSDSTRRTRRAATPRPSRCTRRVSRSASMPDRDRPLSSSNPAVTLAIQLHQAESPRTPTPPGGLAARQHRAPRGAPRRVSRSASMPARTPSGIAKRVDRPLSSSNPALTLAIQLHQAELPRARASSGRKASRSTGA